MMEKLGIKLPKKIIKLRSLNPHIVCLLCAGYFVEATTILECLHTFCKSCIVRYLQSSKLCPTCGTIVHETDPLSNIKLDNVMIDIMNKLIPSLEEEEKKRELKFMENIEKKDAKKKERSALSSTPQINLTYPSHMNKYSEQFNLCLELDPTMHCELNGVEIVEMANKYVRCPGRMKIQHLKKLVRKFYEPHCTNYELKFKCDGQDLKDDEHLRLIYIVYWKRKTQPITLYYRFTELKREVDTCLDGYTSNVRLLQNDIPLPNNIQTSNDKTSVGVNIDNQEGGIKLAADVNDSIIEQDDLIDVDDDNFTQDENSTPDENATQDLTQDRIVSDNNNLKPYTHVSNKPYNQSGVNNNNDNMNLNGGNNVSIKPLAYKSFNGGLARPSLMYTSNYNALGVT